MRLLIRTTVMTVLLSLIAMPLFAQNTVIKGQILDDETKEPLIGVTVMAQRTKTGTVTDYDGNFELSVSDVQNVVLQITYLGYKTIDLPLKDNSYKKILMKSDSKLMDEVVIVGYGTQKKESVIGSIASIDNSALVSIPVSNITQSLAGKLAGVQIVQSSGEVGRDEADIYIRGLPTWGDARPLIVVDGVIRESFAQIDPNEIQSLNVLKDASATAVYGVKGANGVIIITTRRGTASKPQVSFSAQYAITQPTRIPNPLAAYETASLYNTVKYAQGAENAYQALDLIKYRTGSSPYLHPDTHWVDEVMKDNSSMQQYNLNVSGGNHFVKYFVSGGFFDQDGFYNHDPYTNFSRYNFRSNLDFDITKRLKISFNLGSRIEKRQYPGSSRWNSWGIYRGAFAEGGRNNPVYNPDGSLAGSDNNQSNLLGVIGEEGVYKETKSVVEMGLNIRHDLDFLLKGLAIRGQLVYDNTGTNGDAWEKKYSTYYYNVVRDAATDSDKEVYTPKAEEKPLSFSWGSHWFDQKVYGELGFEYEKLLGKHNLTALFLANRNYRIITDYVEFAEQGLVGRVTYDFDKRYFTEVNVGYNGSENFEKGRRYAIFPSLALGWMASNEKFVTDTRLAKIISHLKFRGSIGWVGNDKFGDITKEEVQGNRFAYIQEYIKGGGANFGSGDNLVEGISQGKIANKDLTWETGKKLNGGFELGLFKEKVRLNMDFFYEKRSDILTDLNSIIPGYVGQIFKHANVGIVENKGIELEFIYRNKIGKDFSYNIKGNYSYTRNKIVKRADPQGLLPYQREEGYAIGTPLLYRAIGVFESFDDIANSPSQMGLDGNTEVRPGDVKYLDFNNDGVINIDDAFRQGFGTVPEIQYGTTLSMNYKNLDFSVLFQGSAHSQFAKYWEIMWPFSNADNAFSKHWRYWTPETNGQNEHIRFYGNYLNNEPKGALNSYVMSSGDYVRLKNLEIGYTLPKAWTSKAFMSSARVYFSANNLLLWTDEPFLDPDNRDQRGGLMPQTKAFNFGVNINF